MAKKSAYNVVKSKGKKVKSSKPNAVKEPKEKTRKYSVHYVFIFNIKSKKGSLSQICTSTGNHGSQQVFPEHPSVELTEDQFRQIAYMFSLNSQTYNGNTKPRKGEPYIQPSEWSVTSHKHDKEILEWLKINNLITK